MKLREDGTSPRSLAERAADALARIKSGHGAMRIPPDDADPDLVIADLIAEVRRLDAEGTSILRERSRDVDALEMVGEMAKAIAAERDEARAERDLHKAALEKAQAERNEIALSWIPPGSARRASDDAVAAHTRAWREQVADLAAEASMLREIVTRAQPFVHCDFPPRPGDPTCGDSSCSHPLCWSAREIYDALAAPARPAEWLAEHDKNVRDEWEAKVVTALRGATDQPNEETVSKALADAIAALCDQCRNDERNQLRGASYVASYKSPKTEG